MPQINCPRCGQLNDYDPKFVVRPVRCNQCGQSFTPGFSTSARTGPLAPPPPPLSRKPNRAGKQAILLVVAALLWWASANAWGIKSSEIADCGIPLLLSAGAIGLASLGLIRAIDRQSRGMASAIVGLVLGLFAFQFALTCSPAVRMLIRSSRFSSMLGVSQDDIDAMLPSETPSVHDPGAHDPSVHEPGSQEPRSLTEMLESRQSEVVPPAAAPIRVEEFNFSLDRPESPWMELDVKKINPMACLGFQRRWPEMYFMIIAERTGVEISSDGLAEIALAHLRSFATECEVVYRGPLTVNGLPGVELDVKAQTRGIAFAYSYWVATSHGYYYQLIGYGQQSDFNRVVSESGLLFTRFHLIDPAKQAVPSPGTEPLGSFEAADFGVSMDLTGLGWYRSPRIAKELPSALLCGQHSSVSFFSLQAYRMNDLHPPIDDIARAFATLHSTSFDQATDVIHSTDGDIEICAFQTKEKIGNYNCQGFYKIFRRGPWAYALRTEVGDPGELSSVQLLQNQLKIFLPDKPAVLSPSMKTSSGLLLNGIGLVYDSAQRFPLAAQYFSRGYEVSGQETMLENAATSYEASHDYANELILIKEGQARSPSVTWLAARRAKLEQALGDFSSAAETYKALFETGYRDDNAFEQYLVVLQKMGKTEEAIEAAAAYVSRGDSESIRLDEAILNDNIGRYQQAVDLLRALHAKDPANVRVASELALKLDDNANYDEALAIAQGLIKGGAAGADVYVAQGEAQLGLKRYRDAKESFEAAQKKSPEDATIAKWIQIASAKLGEGDNSSVKTAIEPAAIPAELLHDDPATRPAPPDSSQDAWYVRRITAVYFVPKEHLKTTYYRQVKVLNQHGADYFSKMLFPFDPLAERIYLNKLRVLDDQGNVVATTDVSHCFVTDENAGEARDYRKVLTIPVEGLRVNDTLECVVTVEEISPPPRMQFMLELLAGMYPGAMGALYVSGDCRTLAVVHSAGVNATSMKDGMLWLVSPLPQIRLEPMQPLPDTYLPYVAVGDNQATWKTVAGDYLDSIASVLDLDDDVTKLSRQLTQGLSSQREKVKALTEYVQRNYTYTAIEFGRRALIPNKTSEIVHNKYGDCKDHAVLLLQLLRAASIPANLALANMNQTILPDLPSLDQFTHMIVCVPSLMPDGFFDCTDKLGDLSCGVPPILSQRRVLILDRENPRLVQVPEYPAEDSSIDDARAVSMAASGAVSVEEDLTIQGPTAPEFRYFFNGIAPGDRISRMQEFLAGRGAEVTMSDLKITNLEDSSKPLGMTLSYKVRNCFRGFGAHMAGSIPALAERYFLLPTPVDQRLTPFEYSLPFTLKMSSSINLPAGYTLSDLPSSAAFADGFTNANVQYQKTGDSIRQILAFQSRPFSRPAADYAPFSNSRQNLIDCIEAPLYLTKQQPQSSGAAQTQPGN
jgi:tetratricopeptide (TPR) repeat protein